MPQDPPKTSASDPPRRAARDEDPLDEGRTAPFGWLSLLIILALVVGTWLLIRKLSDDGTLQDCVQSGRRNCAPIEDPGGR